MSVAEILHWLLVAANLLNLVAYLIIFTISVVQIKNISERNKLHLGIFLGLSGATIVVVLFIGLTMVPFLKGDVWYIVSDILFLIVFIVLLIGNIRSVGILYQLRSRF